MSYAICTTEGHGYPHVPLLLYAGSPNLESPIQAEQGADGYELTNRNADGIVGVSDEDLIEAEVDEEPICAECRCLIDHWEHS